MGEEERKFLVSEQASYIRTRTLPTIKQNKNTQGRTSCSEVSNSTCTLLHWSIVPTFKRRQLRKKHTSNDKTNACHETEAATHTGSTALTALSVCFAGFEVNLTGRTVMEVREGVGLSHTTGKNKICVDAEQGNGTLSSSEMN